MIEKKINFNLPAPWINKTFSTSQIGEINFLVGPNGSGKSRFIFELKKALPQSRLLGTDRLKGMGQNEAMGFMADHFGHGFQKNEFTYYKRAGINFGFGIDTIVLLEERLDLRIKVEATLSHLFGRRIILEWDSGNLVPMAEMSQTGVTYRLDRDECHGIKELLVLLTHLYNDENDYLIIDEPELNLHPQYQSFFMQEVRKMAGNPADGKKVIFLVTHSPFILDIRAIDDLQSIIIFDLSYNVPHYIVEIVPGALARIAELIPRLNIHHKQLFFSDHPVFVEGNLDSLFIQIFQERRGISMAGAGSCVIESGGCEEVNKYLELCQAFNKKAYFIYDLDSLFFGNLKACIKNDDTVTDFLAQLGLNSDFGKYCGELDRKINDLIKKLRELDPIPAELTALRSFLDNLYLGGENSKKLARARVSVLVQLHINRGSLVAISDQTAVSEIEGRLNKVAEALERVNVFLLTGGALENYLPSYTGSPYLIPEEEKRKILEEEIAILQGTPVDTLSLRYKGLSTMISKLPGKLEVDIDATLRIYLSNFIHMFQGAVIDHPDWGKENFISYINNMKNGFSKFIEVVEFNRDNGKQFNAKICIKNMFDGNSKTVEFSHDTIAGTREFQIQNMNTN